MSLAISDESLTLSIRMRIKSIPLPSKIDRLLSKAITNKMEDTLLLIKQGECKHPHKLLKRNFETPGFDGRENHFSVTFPTEGIASMTNFFP